MSSRKRKLFTELSVRQKYRRLTEIDEMEPSDDSSLKVVGLNDCAVNNSPSISSISSNSPNQQFIDPISIVSSSSEEDSIIFPSQISEFDLLDAPIISDLESYAAPQYDQITESSSDLTCSSTSFNCETFVVDSLKTWLKKDDSVSKSSVTKLLKILNKKLKKVPRTYDSLLNIDRNANDRPSQVSYIHIDNNEESGDYSDELVEFKWLDDFKLYIATNISQNDHEVLLINIHVNIDGIPIFNNGAYSAYPILVSTREFPEKIFVPYIYFQNKHSNSKGMPSNNNLIQKFVDQLEVLLNEPILVCEKLVNFKLEAIICDAVARAGIKEVVSHTGYHACDRCIQKGSHHANRMCFPETNCNERTNESFRSRTDLHHHKSSEASPFEQLNISMISCFPLDYMHACLLGVMKRLISRLVKSSKNTKKVHLSNHQKTLINLRLKNIIAYIPQEFSRKLGTIDSYLSWKATEFRTFLLYIGVYVFSFKKILNSVFYRNFLLFSISMRMMLTDNNQNNIECIRGMITEFVVEARDLYGISFLSYNVHALTHLPDDYINFGNLNKISCFKYESFLGKHIKGCVKSGFKPVKQIANHIRNINASHVSSVKSNEKSNTVSIKNKTCTSDENQNCFRKLHCESGFTFRIRSHKLKDSCVKLKDGRVGLISEIHKYGDSILLFIHIFSFLKDYFSEPCPSSSVGIYKAKDLFQSEWLSVSSVQAKCFICPHKNHYIVMEMLDI